VGSCGLRAAAPVSLRVLNLFEGIGGFTLAGDRAGLIAVAHSEVDPAARRVLAARFPDTVDLGDVTTITWEETRARLGGGSSAAIDVVTAGWPCQDLSVAGRRAGLAGARSGLWREVVRCLAGLRPRWFVGENVPGLLSSQGGEDFATVLSDLGRLGYGYAYRVLDAQHFGLAQRRKRVFLVGCLGDGPRAAAVLLEPEGVRGDSPAGTTARADVAGTLTRGLGSGGADDNKGQAGWLIPERAGTLGASGQRGGGQTLDRMTFVPELAPTLVNLGHHGRPSDRGDGQTPLVVTRALSTRQTRDDADTQTFVVRSANSNDRERHAAPTETARCLDTTGGFAPSQGGTVVVSPLVTDPYADAAAEESKLVASFHLKQNPISGTVAPALGGSTGGMGVFTRATTTHASLDQGDPDRWEAATVASPRRVHSPVQSEVVTTEAAVRRLTPRECARLQGFPDAWLDGLGLADSTKYRLLGNAVAVPVAEWILRRLAAQA